MHSIIGLAATGNGIPAGAFWRYLAHYDHTLNNNVPLIAGMGLFLAGWYVFHRLAYPKLQERLDDQQGWTLVSLTVLLLVATTFIYHYLKLYVSYQVNQTGGVIGLNVFSLYRKRTVLADAIGLGIVLGVYEAAFQYYQFLARRITPESTRYFRLVSYLLLGVLCVLAPMTALSNYAPLPLWLSGGPRNILVLSGYVLQILALQAYIYTYIWPLLALHRISERELIRHILIYLLIPVGVTLIFWGATTAFRYDNSLPILLMFVVLACSVSMAYLRQIVTKEKIGLQTQVSAGAAELAGLRAQINPHFLFNALNSLYASAFKENSEKTADGIQKLGDMMRFMLQENNRDRIPLDREIEYLHNYIQIQRLRIDETHNIEIRVTIQEPTRPIYLAPMLLTPFVENAFNYGISLRYASWIYITLTLDDTRLYFKVHNSRHPKPPETDPEEAQSGVGLENVRKRLELIYPGQHELVIQQSERDYFVSLSLIYWGNILG